MQHKKEREYKVFLDALAKSRKRGGEARRNVDRINGEILDRGGKSESPDFLVGVPLRTKNQPRRLIGVEHFRVDHYSEENRKRGHMDSLASKLSSQISSLQGLWRPQDDDEGAPSDAVESFANILGEGLRARNMAYYGGFLKAFSGSIRQHLEKCDSYLDNIQVYAGNQDEVQLAFLIEVHTDFSNRCINIGDKWRKVLPGELLIFKDILLELKDASSRIDHFILASYPALRDNIIDSVVLKSQLLEKSLSRQKIPIINYYAQDAVCPRFEKAEFVSHISDAGNSYNFSYDIKGAEMDAAYAVKRCVESLHLAIKDYKTGAPFVASLTLQFLVDVFGDKLLETYAGFPIGVQDVYQCAVKMSPHELHSRIADFEAKWFGEKPHK